MKNLMNGPWRNKGKSNKIYLRVSDMDGCTLKQIEHEVFEKFSYINIDYICAAIRWYSGYYLRPII